MTALAEFAVLSHGWRRFLLLVAAGAVAGLSVPPLFILPALFFGFSVWVWALDGAERRSGLGLVFGPAFTIGFGFGLGYFLVAIHWIGAAFFVDGGVLLALMPLAVLGLAGLLALFWGLASSAAHLLWSEGGRRILALAGALTLAEFARGHLFSGFPFDLVGYALTANEAMQQLASVLGIYGLTFLAILMAATPALVWPAAGRTLAARLAPLFAALLAIAAQLAYGAWRLDRTEVAARTDMRMRLVQPAIPQDVKWALGNREATIERLFTLSETRLSPDDPGLPGVTHLVWPESALPFFLSDAPDTLARIGRLLPEGVTLLTGAPREDYLPDGRPDLAKPGYNSVLAIDSQGEIVASYDKTHLVPFGEYLPFAGFWRSLGIGQLVPGNSGWAPGESRRLLALPGAPAILPLVCYEAVFSGAFSALAQDAELILNVTNDAWFDGSIGPAQHLHHVRLRAVEEGVPIVRAANTGLSAVIDPLGRITASLTPYEMALLDVAPPGRLPPTLFARVGHWPALGLALLALGLAALARPRSRSAFAGRAE